MSRLFLELIQPYPAKSPPFFDGHSLAEITALASGHNLTMLVYSRLKKIRREHGSNVHIDKFLKENMELRLSSTAVSLRQQAIQDEILLLLANNSIPSAVIKGNTLAVDVYDDPNCRSSGDIDILIRMEDAHKTDKILLEAGYQPDNDLPFNYCFYHIHHTGYLHPKYNDHIEIHWHFGLQHFHRISSEQIWQEIGKNSSGIYKLSPEMMFIQLLMHHHHHAFRELRILTDILWAFYRFREILDPVRLFAMLQDMGLLRTAFVCIEQIKDLWPDAAEEIGHIRKLSRKMDNSGIRASGFAVSYFRMELHNTHYNSLKDRFMTRLVHDGMTGMAHSILRAVIPHPKAIKGLYEDQRVWMLPVNYLRFMKWRVKNPD